ncbi:MAG: hypothetical protein V5A64_06735 [Candidatus Thermoplasmatota archaeon]
MQIKNIQLKSIEAKRYSDRSKHPQKVRIDHNSTVSEISKIKDGQANIDFEYTASFGHLGIIKLGGSLIYINKDAEKIVESWRGSHKMPDEVASKIHTAIMHACVPQAVGIAKDLNMPPPIPLPQVKIGKNPKEGQAGPEIA